MKALFVTTLLFASSAMYAQSMSTTADCDCEEYATSNEHCGLVLCKSIEGTITNSSTAVSCACIKVWNGDNLAFATKTDADGNYNLPDVMVGFYTVEIIANGTSYKINNVKTEVDGPTNVSADLDGFPTVSDFSTSK